MFEYITALHFGIVVALMCFVFYSRMDKSFAAVERKHEVLRKRTEELIGEVEELKREVKRLQQN